MPLKILIFAFITTTLHNPTSSDFISLSKTPYYVDKTEMIKVFFKKAPYHFITCPRGFGKSTNLQMLKQFINIEVDDKGSPLNYLQTKAYQVFKNFNIVKFHRNGTFLQNHMAQHPVLLLELSTNKSIHELDTPEGITTYLNEKLRHSFKDYQWLWEIPRMNATLKSYEISFLQKLQTSELNHTEIFKGLRKLCKILHRHFDKKVIVLVDQYDHVINHEAIWSSNRTIRRIYQATNTMLLMALGNTKLVQNWIITGTCSMPFRGSYLTETNSNHHSFLNEHEFTYYYGFLKHEINKLCYRKCTGDEKLQIKDYYNGYKTRGTKISLYNPKSITEYFITKDILKRHDPTKLKSYWRMRHNEIEFFYKPHENLPGFEADIKKLVGNGTITYKKTRNFLEKDLRIFYGLKITGKNFYIKHYNLVMHFLFEHGYLVPTLKNINEYKIPNAEIAIELKSILEECNRRNHENLHEDSSDFE